jgi:arylsulfatase A-like enzyme
VRKALVIIGPLVIYLGIGGLGCSSAPEKWNVVFILIDTLRADHISMYGYDRPTSPYLEEFAREAIVFEQARAQAGCTYPSVNSILTSQYPQVFLGDGNGQIGISDQWVTLAQMLRAEGYQTAAVSSSTIVRVNPSKINPHGGFGAGFDTFDDTCMQEPAECVNNRTFEILDSIDTESPFFLYLHYMEPHMPYQPPNTHGPVFRFQSGPHVTRDDRKPHLVNRKIYGLNDMLYEKGDEIEFTESDLARMINLYDEEIHYFDAQFQALLQRLETAGVAERTVFIVTSDHGEELLDHGHIMHCRDLTFDSVIRIPLIFKIPGVRQVGPRSPMVQTIDIIPTLLDYLGIDSSPYDLKGLSLRPVIEEEASIHDYLFCSQRYSRSVVDGRFKLVYDIKNGKTRLFDLKLDPTEQKNIRSQRPEIAEKLNQVLLDWIAEVEGRDDLTESVQQEEEAHEMLRALGYLGDYGEAEIGLNSSGSPQDQALSPKQIAERLVDGLKCGQLEGTMISDQGQVFAWGWAYDPQVGKPAESVIILVDGGPLSVTATVDRERPDVAKFFNDESRRLSGWGVYIDQEMLGAGEHKLEAYAVLQDGGLGRLVSDDRGIIKVPDWN